MRDLERGPHGKLVIVKIEPAEGVLAAELERLHRGERFDRFGLQRPDDRLGTRHSRPDGKEVVGNMHGLEVAEDLPDFQLGSAVDLQAAGAEAADGQADRP